MCKKTMELTNQHNQLVNKILAREARRKEFVNSILKMCPRCGTLNQLDAGGCVSCLYQFKEYKYGKQ